MNKRIILSISFVILIYLVIGAYIPIVAPLIIGALLAYLLYPVVCFLKNKTKLSHNFSSILVFVLFSFLLVFLIVFSAPKLFNQFQSLQYTIEEASIEIYAFAQELTISTGIDFQADQILESFENEVSQFLNPDRLFRLIQAATDNIFWVIIIFVSCLFWLKDW